MAEAIRMPELGQATDQGTIVEWLVAEGAPVEMGQMLFVVQTDKAEVEVECVADGVLLRIVVPKGETVETGTVVAYVGEPGEAVDGLS
jgi:pyruvate/2-oxoglutarate dehydrogenase complex dihydrolipoamide acyltransferase (E2) component